MASDGESQKLHKTPETGSNKKMAMELELECLGKKHVNSINQIQ